MLSSQTMNIMLLKVMLVRWRQAMLVCRRQSHSRSTKAPQEANVELRCPPVVILFLCSSIFFTTSTTYCQATSCATATLLAQTTSTLRSWYMPCSVAHTLLLFFCSSTTKLRTLFRYCFSVRQQRNNRAHSKLCTNSLYTNMMTRTMNGFISDVIILWWTIHGIVLVSY